MSAKRARRAGHYETVRRKKVKAEPTPPPQVPYVVKNDVPVSKERPDYEKIEGLEDLKESGSLYYSLQKSRNTWLSGSMFQKYWSKPVRGRKPAGGDSSRDRMTKLCDCTMVMGPHIFETRLFIVKDDNPIDPPEEEPAQAPVVAGSPATPGSSSVTGSGSPALGTQQPTRPTILSPVTTGQGVPVSAAQAPTRTPVRPFGTPPMSLASSSSSASAPTRPPETASVTSATPSAPKTQPAVAETPSTTTTTTTTTTLANLPTQDTAVDATPADDSGKKDESTELVSNVAQNQESSEKSVSGDKNPAVGSNVTSKESVTESGPAKASPAAGDAGTDKTGETTTSTTATVAAIEPAATASSTSTSSTRPTSNSATSGGHNGGASTTAGTATATGPSTTTKSNTSIVTSTTGQSAFRPTSSTTTTPIRMQTGVVSSGVSTTTPVTTSAAPTSASTATRPLSSSPATSSRPAVAAPNKQEDQASNQETILKLQYIAKLDPSLSNLMKIVASGKATSAQIAAFQEYINMARRMPMPSSLQRSAASPSTATAYRPTVQPRPLAHARPLYTPGSAPTIQRKPIQSRYVPKMMRQSIMIVFEFKDNPLDRFILPKESVLEVLPSGDILLSFLVIHRPPASVVKKAKKKEKAEKSKAAIAPSKTDDAKPDASLPPNSPSTRSADKKPEPPLDYTPTTITLCDLPSKHVPVVARCVNRYDRVVKRMEEVLKTGNRTQSWSVWYHIPEGDAELVEAMQKVPPGPLDAIPPKRSYKPRQKKDPNDSQPKNAKLEGSSGTQPNGAPTTAQPAPAAAGSGTATASVNPLPGVKPVNSGTGSSLVKKETAAVAEESASSGSSNSVETRKDLVVAPENMQVTSITESKQEGLELGEGSGNAASSKFETEKVSEATGNDEHKPVDGDTMDVDSDGHKHIESQEASAVNPED